MVDRSTSFSFNYITAVVADPSNSYLYVATLDGYVYKWDAATGTTVASQHIGGSITALAMSADGTHLVAGEADPIAGQPTIFENIAPGDLSYATINVPPVNEAYGSRFGVSHLAVTAAGLVIYDSEYSASGAMPAWSFSLANPGAGATTYPLTVEVGGAMYLSDGGRHVWSTVGTEFFLYDIQAGTSRVSVSAGYQPIAVSDAAGLMVSAGSVYDLNLNFVVDTNALYGGVLAAAVFTPDGHQLLEWDSTNNLIRVFDTHSWAEVGTIAMPAFQAGPAGVPVLQIGDHGQFLYAAGNETMIDLAARMNLTITGTAGADTLYGSVGSDIINGGGGDDTIDGGGGDDTMDGGTGVNTVAYASATAGVTVSLALQGSAQNTIGAGTDALSNFQNIMGSAFADTLTGDANDNVIDGGGGGGGGGGDILDGGGGVNTVSFASAVAGVNVSLALQGQAQNTVGAGTDTLSDFQNVTGSAFDDTLEGDGNNNTLNGGTGINTVSYAHAASGVTVSLVLQGSAQNTVGAGSDTLSNFQNLTGSAFNDTLEGDGNNNVLDGKAGTNTVTYAHSASGVTVSLALQGAAQNTVGAGSDTLSNFQNLTGSAFNDTLEGGGAASTTLTGGAGADTFVYGVGDGAVTITDFSHAQGDKLDLSSLNRYWSLPQLLSTAVQSGSDTVIDLGSGGSLILKNMTMANLAASDFVFSTGPIQVGATTFTTDATFNLTLTSGPLIQFTASNGGVLVNNGSLTLTSSGYGAVEAVDVVNSGNTTALVRNYGAITISGYDVGFGDVALENYGSVSINPHLSGDAIASGAGGNLTNAGSISVTGGGGPVYGELLGGTGFVHNLVGATLSATAMYGATGVSMLKGGELVNAGAITATAGNAGAQAAIGVDESDPNLGLNAAYALITNSGSITASGSGAVGIKVELQNNAYTLHAPGAGQYNLVNSGVITAPTAIQFVAGYNASAAAIDNSGTINGAVLLSEQNDRLVNTGTINGAVNLGDGNDTLDSHAGTITGVITLGSGSSTATLGAENNTVSLGAGTHAVDGGGGINTVSYAASVNAYGGVSVDLAAQGQAQYTGISTDTLSNFQNVTGSAFDDTLEGDGNNNVLNGSGGTNTVSYAHAASGVTVSLALQGQAQNTVGAGTDTLSNFQNLTGSAFSDTLEGNGSSNVLDGDGGLNTVSYAHAASGVTVSLALQGQGQNTGGAGTDTLFNFQNLIGSAYADTLTSSIGFSSLTGGGGADTFKIAAANSVTTITDFSHAQGDKIDLTALSQFSSLASVMAAAVQNGANTVIHTGSSSLVLDNVTATNLTAADFKFAGGSNLPDPYDSVCYITVAIDGQAYRGSGVIVGPHTILTAAHMVWDQDSGQSATNIEVYPGYSTSYQAPILAAAIHYNAVDDANGLLAKSDSQSDFAVIDVAQNLESYGWFQIDPDYAGGFANISGYPGAHGSTQQDTSGFLTTDPNYHVIDYSASFGVSPGSSGGPIWINQGTASAPSPSVVGVVSTADWGAQITSADLAQIEGWVAQDKGLFSDAAGDISGSIFDDHLIGDSGPNIIDGLGGDDVLTGGGGSDSFVMDAGAGRDIITDFDTAHDTIDVSAYFSNLAGVQTATSQQGPNAVIQLGGGSLTLDNVSMDSLVANDFSFTHDVNFEGAYRQYTVTIGAMTTVSGGPDGGAVIPASIQRIQFADGYLAISPTDTAGQVYRIYEATLGRAPDQEGLTNWVNGLNSGASLQSVVGGFVNSTEFQQVYGPLDDPHFVTLLYHNVLHRDPDQAGLNNWVGMLTSGQETRAQVVLGFSESPEDVNDLAAPVQQGLWIANPDAGEVARLYDTVLGRLPDGSGLANWTHSLESGASLQSVADGFVGSAEFQAVYGTLNNSDFVTLLYHNVLHRDPDQAGLTNWVSNLASGETRAQVVVGFSESAEHITNTAPHIDSGVWLA